MGKKAHRPKDKYYTLAKEQGFRARSAFKLIQLNRKYDFLGRSQVLIDLCAAPGGWLQVASKYMPVSSMIIGVDLVPIRTIRNVITHACDITTNKCRNLLKKDMGKLKADVVLHDGAPNVGAAWVKDAFGQSELVLHSLKLATEFLKKDGWFITKVFRSSDYNSLLWVFQQLFRKVEATKPHSSRNASAEIFVSCQGFLAPDKLDPRMLDPEYVFKTLDPAKKKAVDVLHTKNKAKRNREGYDDDIGVVLHKKDSVARFIESEDPVRVMSECNQLVFDEGCDEYKAHPATTAEVLACLDDLKVLGKRDFRGLLKWRGLIRRDQKAKAAALAAEKGEDEEDKRELSPEERAALDEAAAQVELHELADAARLRRKREKKKVREKKAKQIRRVALGMENQAVELLPDTSLFSLDAIKSRAQLDAAAEVTLDDDADDAVMAAMHGGEDSGSGSDSDSDEVLDSADEADRYQQQLEDEASAAFDARQSRAARRTLEADDMGTRGTRLTRKQRAMEEAKIKEAQAMAKLDHAHQRYLKLLSKAGKRKGDSDDEDSDDSDDDDSSDDSDGSNPLLAKLGSSGDDGAVTAAAAAERAERWFSQPLFKEAEEDAAATLAAATRAHANRFAGSSDEEEDDETGAMEPEADAVAERPRTRRGGRGSGAGAGSGAGGVELEELPLTEKEKRRLKRRKTRKRNEAKAKRKRKREEDFEVVAAEEEASDVEMGSDGEELTEEEKAKRQARRELIRAGMGKALGADDGGDFEIVAAPDSEAEEEDGRPDLRDEAYDSDTHAELLALGKKMRKHTTAKALIDASYNRYSFNDDFLPTWFANDEQRHFRPQLPVTKAEVDEIKRNFRDIAARPVHKVAEARARKKRRLMKNLEKARAQAANIAKSEDMGSRSKAKAIQRLYTKAQLKKADNVYVVMRNGHKVAVTGGTKGSGKVKMVDARLRSDTNAQKRAEKRRKGEGKKKGRGRRSKGRNKRQR